MTDDEQSELVDRAERLQGAVDDASRHMRNVYITFLTFALYVVITIYSTTDLEILYGSENSVQLPLLNTKIHVVGFYIAVPCMILLFHTHLLLRLYLLSEKLHMLDGVLENISDPSIRDEQRVRVIPFSFSHMLIGRRGGGIGFMLSTTVWVSMLLLPATILVLLQVRFLPYRSSFFLWMSRGVIFFDVMLMLFLWPKILHPGGSWTGWFNECWADFTSAFEGQNIRSVVHLRNPFFLAVMSLFFLVFSFFIATVPDGGMYGRSPDLLRSLLPDPWRHYNLAGKTIVAGNPSPEKLGDIRGGDPEERRRALQSIKELDLSKRDLRSADFSNAEFFKVDVSQSNLKEAVCQHATFYGTKFRGTNLEKADLRETTFSHVDFRPVHTGNTTDAFVSEGEQKNANLSPIHTEVTKDNFEGGYFKKATLEHSRLEGAKLKHARLHLVRFNGANLKNASLPGAQLTDAELQGTNFREANLMGANLRGANASGANFSFARLHGGNFRWAELKGSNLFRGKFQGCNFRWADLTGANLRFARLQGANMYKVTLDATNMYGANVKGADIAPETMNLVDLRNVNHGTFQKEIENRNEKLRKAKGVEKMRLINAGKSFVQIKKEINHMISQKKKYGERLKERIIDSLKQRVGEESSLGERNISRSKKDFKNKEALQKRDRKLIGKFVKLCCDNKYVARQLIERLHLVDLSVQKAGGGIKKHHFGIPLADQRLLWKKLPEKLLSTDCKTLNNLSKTDQQKLRKARRLGK